MWEKNQKFKSKPTFDHLLNKYVKQATRSKDRPSEKCPRSPPNQEQTLSPPRKAQRQDEGTRTAPQMTQAQPMPWGPLMNFPPPPPWMWMPYPPMPYPPFHLGWGHRGPMLYGPSPQYHQGRLELNQSGQRPQQAGPRFPGQENRAIRFPKPDDPILAEAAQKTADNTGSGSAG